MKELLLEMFIYLDTYGEHLLVSKYQKLVSADLISSVIGAWACSLKPVREIAELHYERFCRINSFPTYKKYQTPLAIIVRSDKALNQVNEASTY